ncbi:MAG: histidinol dehydrogenase [Anaerolineae bacterium]|nr:histidinol dehydrogenase [Anaerolineae bacterium]
MTELLPIYSLADAKTKILLRRPPDETEVTPAISKRLEELFDGPVTPEEAVRRILTAIRDGSDNAVGYWTKKIDGVQLDALYVPEIEIHEALDRIPQKVAEALQLAAGRIENFHRTQAEHLTDWYENGLGQILRPITKVGVYVPGGTAPLPSSLLMSAIPALVAGVEEIIICTPPQKDGTVNPVILAAAAVCGIKKVFKVGGAQAIAAMAYGTQTIPRVDKIVGPGNLFVTLAKRQVFGVVGIDGLPGPTETMIIADESANPALAAADLLAQAEHDVLASAILVTPSRNLAKRVQIEVARQLEHLDRDNIIAQSLSNQGGVVIVNGLVEAFEVANEYAAEHLCLLLEDPFAWIGEVKNAGGIFLGEGSFEVLGDYVAGPSHVMPTGGTARFSSPLNILDFIKITSVIGLDHDTAAELSKAASVLAHAESLTAHAAAAEARIQE